MPSASRFTRQSRRIGASSSITSTVVIRSTARYTRAIGSSLARDRQREGEAGALAFGRVDPDAAAHRRDEALRDEEAEARTARAGVRRRLGAVELAEDPLLLGARDP